MALTLLSISLASFLAGAGFSLFLRRSPGAVTVWSSVAAILGSLALLGAGTLVLAGEKVAAVSWPLFQPLANLTIKVDSLSAFFLIIIGLVGTAASIYALGYLGHLGQKTGEIGFWYNLFLLGMGAVVVSNNAITFLFFWETMALASFFLVVYDRESQEGRRAGFIYLVMAHLGTACLLVLFLWPASQNGGSLDFTQMAVFWPHLPVGEKAVLFLLALAGFGSKAGLVPLHIWLPRAHPAAPSHVSALMSGVMLKVAIYAFLRVVFVFMGTPPLWWGALVLGLGAFGAVLGILYALMDHDLKRLLAYSSVENIGIIFMGLGAALLFRTMHMPGWEALGLLAALYHSLNHGAFKGLLFLGSGAVVQGAGTKNMERLGGLIQRMPWTAAGFLTGSVAISALPPLNGFASEWLTFQALLGLGYHPTIPLMAVAGALGVGALGLTGGLALACFVKAFGVTFLALPRSQKAATAREVSPAMHLGAALLAVSCLLLGLFPAQVAKVLAPVMAVLRVPGSPWSSNVPAINPILLAVILATTFITLWLGRSRQVHLRETWACGGTLTPQTEYSAISFAKPFRLVFAFLFQPVREIISQTGDSPYFRQSMRYRGKIKLLFEEYLYRPVQGFVLRSADGFRKVQSGNLRTYLTYLFLTLLALLAVNNR